jgi:hypothetical protein
MLGLGAAVEELEAIEFSETFEEEVGNVSSKSLSLLIPIKLWLPSRIKSTISHIKFKLIYKISIMGKISIQI